MTDKKWIQLTYKVREEVETERLKGKAITLRGQLAIPDTKIELIKFIKYLSELIKDERVIKKKE